MLAFLLALSFGGFIGWTNIFIVILIVMAVALLSIFVYIENHTEQPMLDMKLLKTRALAFAYWSGLLNGISRGSVNFLLVFYYQGIKGMDPIIAGIMLTPFAISMMIVAPISGWLSDKYGSRILSSAGLLISAFGLIGFIFITPDTPLLQLAIWMFIMGFGSGMFFSPNTNAIMGAVPVGRRGIAAGVRTMMTNAGRNQYWTGYGDYINKHDAAGVARNFCRNTDWSRRYCCIPVYYRVKNYICYIIYI
ncbi:MAG TPA: MFS transporter [Anaerovoracaceae bacterium]|nr:MFS transporter [Anaerovoracaceae bacterium]